jgi:hypothetical protein
MSQPTLYHVVCGNAMSVDESENFAWCGACGTGIVRRSVLLKPDNNGNRVATLTPPHDLPDKAVTNHAA